MSRDAGDLLQDALQLAPEARAALAASLLESLDDQVDADAEREWRTTIERRMAELNSGAVQSIGWPGVRDRLIQHLGK